MNSDCRFSAAQRRLSFAGIIRYGFYPLALGWTLLFICLESAGLGSPREKAHPLYLASMIAAMVILDGMADAAAP